MAKANLQFQALILCMKILCCMPKAGSVPELNINGRRYGGIVKS